MPLSRAKAVRWNLFIQQGSLFERTLTFPTIEITDWDFRGQIRAKHNSPTVLAHLNFTKLDEHRLRVFLTPVQTEGLPPKDDLVHDIEIYNADESVVMRILEGTARVSPEVTR